MGSAEEARKRSITRDTAYRPFADAVTVFLAHRTLSESTRRAVRDEVHSRLTAFESGGRLVMAVEMLIAAGRS